MYARHHGAATETADICVLLNPGSGRRKDRQTEARLRAALDRHPGRFALRIVARGKSLTEAGDQAATDGFATLVAAGGDGTICALAAVAMRHGVTLGILPMGTFNYVARGLDIPDELDAAVDLIAFGSVRKLSPGDVNGTPFLNNASLGLYPQILAQREGIYRRWGRSRLAAHWSVLATFARFRSPLRLRLTIDGRALQATTPIAFVARSAFQLDEFGLDGAEAVRDGALALFLAPDTTRWGLLLFALRLAWRQAEPGRDFTVHTGREITIETRQRRRRLARDGERSWMDTPFRFRVLDDALSVIAPTGTAPARSA